jgi:hypothetical protein
MFCVPALARCEPITFQFDGVLTGSEGRVDFFGAGPVAEGTRFSGEFSYDPATAFLEEFGVGGGLFFVLFTGPASMTIRVGNLDETMPFLGLRPDSGAVFSNSTVPSSFPFNLSLSTVLFLGNSFQIGAPSARTLLEAFDASAGSLQLTLSPVDDDPAAALVGRLRSLTHVSDTYPVPEPATIVLVATGAVLLVRRRQARSHF